MEDTEPTIQRARRALLDALPDEILHAIMRATRSIVALARAGQVSHRLNAAAMAVRAEWARTRRARGSHSDAIGSAHALLNAIAADNVDVMAAVFDVGRIDINDEINTPYLRAICAPNLLVLIPSPAEYGRLIYTIMSKHMGYMRPLLLALFAGSARCLTALIAMGATLNGLGIDDLIRHMLYEVAWKPRVFCLEPGRVKENLWSVPINKRRVVRRDILDPVAVLAPILRAFGRSQRQGVGFHVDALLTSVRKNACRLGGTHTRVPVASVVALIKLLIACGYHPDDPETNIPSSPQVRALIKRRPELPSRRVYRLIDIPTERQEAVAAMHSMDAVQQRSGHMIEELLLLQAICETYSRVAPPRAGLNHVPPALASP